METWVEIAVDEDLLAQVVRELLNMAVDPNHVEVAHATTGRVILAEARLAEHWYQERLSQDTAVDAQSNVDAATTSLSTAIEDVDAATNVVAPATTVVASATTEAPVKRGPGRPRNVLPSASPNSEES
jgi:hypothetical protein